MEQSQTQTHEIPVWKNKYRPIVKYDPDDVYDRVYEAGLRKLLTKAFKDEYNWDSEIPEMTYCRLYDVNDDPETCPFYIASMLIVDYRRNQWRTIFKLLAINYRISICHMPVETEDNEAMNYEYIFVSPFYEWEDANYYLKIRSDITDD